LKHVFIVIFEGYFRRTIFPGISESFYTVHRISQIKTDSWYYTNTEEEDLFLLVAWGVIA